MPALIILLCAAARSETYDMFSVGMISTKTEMTNPLYTEEREIKSVFALMYESLIVMDDDYMPQAKLAESWNCDNNAKTWTFRIRRGVTFHDGTPMTAYDAAATINEILRLAEEGQGQYANLKYMVKSCMATDEYTLIVTAARTSYELLFAMTFPILPRDQLNYRNPAGTGPYYLQGFAPRDYIYLTANDNWWQAPPLIRQINVVLFNTNKDLINAYEYNRLDAIVTRSSSASQYSRSGTTMSMTYRTQQLETLMVNRHSFPLTDEAVRKALRLAINPDVIVSSAYQDMADRTDTPLHQGTWMYQGSDTAYRYDPEEARRILEEDGWMDMDNDGMLNKIIDGKVRNLHVQLYVYEEQDNSVRVSAAGQIANMLESVGFGVKITTGTFQEAGSKLSAGSYDLCLAAFQMDPVPDPGFLLMRNNTCNYSRYSSTQMDDLFKRLRTAPDYTTFRSTLYEIQDLFAKDQPFICLYYRTGAVLTRRMYTTARDIRETEIFRGIESYGRQ